MKGVPSEVWKKEKKAVRENAFRDDRSWINEYQGMTSTTEGKGVDCHGHISEDIFRFETAEGNGTTSACEVQVVEKVDRCKGLLQFKRLVAQRGAVCHNGRQGLVAAGV